MKTRKTLPINRIITETREIKTYFFHTKLEAKPGQFVMLTDLDGGEKPFSVADCSEKGFYLTIKKVGEFTKRLFKHDPGDLVSVRGPYGKPFTLKSGKVMLIGGGYGTPPLYFLARKLIPKGAEITVVNGAKTKTDLLFCDRFRDLNLSYHRITQAGCLGRKATSVEIASELMEKEKFDFIYAAGPELMLKAVQKIVGDTDYEFLMERYMKCGVGICGSCTVDPLGIRLCVEGPVLKRNQVEKLTEFGLYHREAAGNKVLYQE